MTPLCCLLLFLCTLLCIRECQLQLPPLHFLLSLSFARPFRERRRRRRPSKARFIQDAAALRSPWSIWGGPCRSFVRPPSLAVVAVPRIYDVILRASVPQMATGISPHHNVLISSNFFDPPCWFWVNNWPPYLIIQGPDSKATEFPIEMLIELKWALETSLNCWFLEFSKCNCLGYLDQELSQKVNHILKRLLNWALKNRNRKFHSHKGTY